MRLGFKSIATRIAVAFAFVIPIVTYALWSEASRSWDNYRAAEVTDSENAAADMLITGVSKVLIERQLRGNALQAPGPASFDEIKEMADQRAKASAEIDAALNLLDHEQFPHKEEMLGRFKTALAQANIARDKSDDAVKQPKSARDKDAVANTYAILSDFVVAGEQLWTNVLSNTAASELARLANIRILAWNMRDVAGRERSAIGRAIAGGAKISTEDLANIGSFRSQVELTWKLMQNNLRERDRPEIVEGIDRLRNGYLAKFPLLAEQTIKASVADAKYSMTVKQWNDATTPLLNSILDVLDDADKASEIYSTGVKTDDWKNLIFHVALLAACLMFFAGATVFSVITVARPMRALTKPLDELADGNFSAHVPGLDRGDEIGQIARSVETMAAKVRAALLEIKTAAREVTNASAEIATSTTDLSQRTEEQAASLEETSASMEQIASIVKQNAVSAKEASRSAAQTGQIAAQSGAVVAKAVEAMARIEESSNNISEIIVVIDEIARQTNLLALNAAVEAARAGEAGRGFAVVASEVRSLAQRSSQAAKDITALITKSGGQVQEGVQLVNQAGSALSEITKSIQTVTENIRDIASAGAEQSTGVDEVNKAMTIMDAMTQQNSALVEENAATAKALEIQAQNMDRQVGFFRIEAGSAGGGAGGRQAGSSAAKRAAPARTLAAA